MGELTRGVIQKIEKAKEFDDIKDWIWMAGDLMRRASSSGFCSAFKEIDQEVVDDDERTALKNAALNALTRNFDPMWVQSFLSVLRGANDSDLLQVWIEHLTQFQSTLKESNGIVFNILLALKDLGEPVFQDARSLCVVDVDRNMAEADKYLRKHDILIPG